MKEKKGLSYDIGSVVLIVYVFVILIVRFNIFPIFIDIYYHLAAMQGYNLARGITANAYWEFAPFGRPQLYPPLLHIIMLFMLKCGVSISFIAKFISFVIFPLTVLTVWFTVRAVYGKRPAFFSVVFLAGASTFFYHMSVLSAAALAQILGLLAFVSIEKDLKFASPVLPTLMLYSHIAIPYFYFVAFLIYGIFRKEKRKIIFRSLLISALLYSPWLIHTIVHLRYIMPRSPDPPGLVPVSVSLNLWLWVFGIAGVVIAIFKRKKYLFPVFLLVLLTPVMLGYQTRFWEVHTIIPLSILSGIFPDHVLSSLRNQSFRKFVVLVLLIALFISPRLSYGRNGVRINVQPSFERIALSNYRQLEVRLPVKKKPQYPVNRENGRIMIKGNKILSDKNIKFAEMLKSRLPKGASIYVPDGVFGDFLFAFSGVPVSSGMLREVKPYRYPSQADDAYFVIDGNVASLMYPLNKTFQKFFSAFGKTVFKNRMQVKKVLPEKPVLPISICFILLILSAIIILYDFLNRRKVNNGDI